MRIRSAGKKVDAIIHLNRSMHLLLTLALLADMRGFPLMTTFAHKQHNGGAMVYSMTQARDGRLVFGTLSGLLRYDGAYWSLTRMPNDSAVFAVARGDGEAVGVGAVNELGIFTNGVYHSLLRQLPPQFREPGDVRAVCATDDGFVFVGENFVATWNGKTARVIDTARDASSCFTANRVTYLAGANGVQRIGDGRAFEGKNVELVLPFADNRVLVSVAGEGLFVWDGHTTSPFPTPELLRTKQITAGCRLSDGRIVIGTREDGIVILRADGSVEQQLDRAAGLPSRVLTSAFVDRENALWLTFQGPIVRVDLTSPVTLFDERHGLRGTANAVAQHRGRTYVGTSHGLFALDAPAARKIDGIPAPAWSLLSLEDMLVVGTSAGAFLIDANENVSAIPGTESSTVYDALHSQRDPSVIWLATKRGIGRLRQTQNSWRFDGILAATPSYVRSLAEKNGVLWAGTVFDGVVRVDANDRVQTFGSGEMSVADLGDRIVFPRADAIVNINPAGAIVPDPLLGHITGNFYHVAADARGTVWTSHPPPRSYARLANGQYSREGSALTSIDAAVVQLVQPGENGTMWFGTDQGLYRYDPTATPLAPLQPAPVLRHAFASPLPYAFGRIRLEFAPLSFRPGVAYQYRLDPADADWSAWSSEPFLDYTNLEAGTYTFRLRSRGTTGLVSGETRWSFTVAPPWYRTRWALAAGIVALLLLIAMLVRLRTTALRKQAERLRALVNERTEDLREANLHLERLSLLDELTGIANRRYFQRALVEGWRTAHELRQPLALILLDLDHFKRINDELGHPAGDATLITVGRHLAKEVRRSGDFSTRSRDLVARIGGEEFAVLLSNTDLAFALHTAERLRAGIATLPAGVTASCGVASIIPNAHEGWNALVEEADRALYAAKNAGRNCVRTDGDPQLLVKRG